MKPDGIHTLALLTPIDKFADMKNMYTNLLNAREVFDMPGMVVYELPNQMVVELYTEIADAPSYLFKNQSVVLGFRTEHINAMFEQLENEHYTLLCPIQQAGECYEYFHFLSPDGQVYLISQLNKHAH